MSFLRAEARATLWHWREVLAGGALLLAGLWLTFRIGFLLDFVGIPMIIGGAALIWLGVQRARFRSGRGGPGAVAVDEGEVTYFGPLTGGSVALRELESLTIDGNMFPAHWRLEQRGAPPLLIPVNAEGSDALFDAFASLPGLRTEQMLSALKSNRRQAIVVWQRGTSRPEGLLLH
ncbi:MAG: hypothetical protein HKN30_07370 [Sulfitobacter sp.]|nr:hypothetical protein [Sulfitobacter sp.]